MGGRTSRLHARFDGITALLCLGAHPDDIEIGCGATLFRLLAEQPGMHVTWVVLSGDAVRAAEARRSAESWCEAAAGVDIVLEEFPDSFFPSVWRELKDSLHRLGERIDPDLVLTHRRDDLHQDHRLVGELTWNVFRDHLILEYEIPKYEGDLGRPNLFTVLDEATCRKKIESIRRHFISQRAKPYLSEEMLWATLRLRGLEAAAPSGLAEGLYSRKLTI